MSGFAGESRVQKSWLRLMNLPIAPRTLMVISGMLMGFCCCCTHEQHDVYEIVGFTRAVTALFDRDARGSPVAK